MKFRFDCVLDIANNIQHNLCDNIIFLIDE